MNKQAAQTLKTLTKARALIKKGWIKGRERAYAGDSIRGETIKIDSYCAIGALREADGPGEINAFKVLRNAISVLFYMGKKRTGERGIYQFNDRKKTTKDDVLAAFDKAIEMVNVDVAQ